MNIQDLIQLIQQDNEAAFNTLFKQQANKLYQFAYAILGEREPAEEIVNDIFIKIWLNRKKLGHVLNFQVYLFVTVKNACLNVLRGNSSKILKEADIARAYYFQLSADPSQLLISKELETRILRAVDELPPRCKLIFKMVKQDDLSVKEVSAILNLSNKTVFAQLAIALTKLEMLLL